MRVHQPGGHLMRARGANIDDWSWRATVRRVKTLARLTAAYKARTALAIFFLLLATGVSLLPPYLAKVAIDHGIQKQDERALLIVTGLFVLAGLALIAASAAQTYFTGWTGERILADLRNTLFRHLQRLSLGFYERNRAGVIISRLTNDVEALDQLVTDGFTSLIQNSLTLIGTAIILFLLDWRLALAVMTILPLARHRHGSVPEAFGARLPAGSRAARPRHRDARGRHRRHACRPGVHAGDASRSARSARSTSAIARRTSGRSCSTASTSRSSTSSPRSRPRSCSATAATSSSTET